MYVVSVTAKTVETWFNNHRRVQAYAGDREGGGAGGWGGGNPGLVVNSLPLFLGRTAGGGGDGADGRAFFGSTTSGLEDSGSGGGEGKEMGEWIEDVSDGSDESEWEEVLFREENEVLRV
jgi:hypothetical protein